MSDRLNNNDLLDTTDASVWAARFVALFPEADEGLMLSWFASAIETGRAAGDRPWRASGLTPEQAQRLGVMVLGGLCANCGSIGVVSCQASPCGHGGHTCPDRNGSGRTPSLADRLGLIAQPPWPQDAQLLRDTVAALREAQP
jgi:hypothetical protein